MNIWEILGIEKTKDKDLIKNAYREKLVLVNPEENQQGFMELRRAYEEAVAEADKPDVSPEEAAKANQEEEPKTPVGIWMKKVDTLYQDIELRGNEVKWKELLEDDVCFSLETKTEARDELLCYFMSHYYLPQKIWRILDDKFLLREYKDELYESFPENYVEQGIIGNIENKEYIDIQYIESKGGTDYDEFLYKSYEVYHLLAEGKMDEIGQRLEEIDAFKLYHPYIDVFRIKYLLSGEDAECKEEAENLAKNLLEKMPEDEEIRRSMAEVYCAKEEFDKAKELYEKILEGTENLYSVKVALGNICFRQKDFIEAKKYYDEAYDIHKNDYLGQSILNCIEEIEKLYKQRWEENPENLENAIELARTYYQQSKFEESLELLMSIQPDEENHLEYVHLLGCNYMYKEDYERALTYLLQWVAITEKLEPDGTEKRKKEMKRLCAAYHCTAQTLAGLKQYEEADKFFDKALGTGNQTIDVYEEKARIYFNRRMYDQVIEICDKIFECDSHSPLGHAFRGEAFYELGYYLDSQEEWDYCIGISPSNLSFYIKKADCFYLMERYDEALEVLTFVKEHGAESDSITMWEAMIENEKGDGEKALKTLLDLSIKAESTKDFEAHIVDRLYFEIARIYARNKSNDEAEFYLEKALKKNPHFIRAIIYKAHMCWQKKEYDQAIACFKQVIEENPNYVHVKAYGRIGEIYEEQAEYEKAIEYYSKQLEIAPDAFCYLSKGWCFEQLKRYTEARLNYEKNIELDPANINTYCLIGNIYRWQGDNEKAAEYFDEAFKKRTENMQPWQYRVYVQVLRRVKRWDRAIEVLMECIEIVKEPEDIKRLADLYMARGYYADAMKQYAEFAKTGPENRITAWENMADCLILEGNIEEAKKTLQRLYGDSPASADQADTEFHVIKQSVYLLLMKKKMFQAKMKYQSLERHARKNETNDAKNLVFLRCQMMLTEGKKKPIFNVDLIPYIENLKKEAAEMDVLHGEARKYTYLAIAELAKDDYMKALDYTEKALACKSCSHCQDISCHEAAFVKGLLLEIMGRFEEAELCYRSMLEANLDDVDYMFAYTRVKEKTKM